MEKLFMERKAADNKYLHRDFHKLLDVGLAYIGARYGDDGVRQYLREFAAAYYAPLIEKIKLYGLAELAAHIRSIYELEEASETLTLALDGQSLNVRVEKCPAVEHFKTIGHTASKWYVETTRTVNETIADLANLNYSQRFYDEETGKCEYAFTGRNA